MPETTRPTIVIPGDEPPQLAGTSQLEGLRALGEVILYTDHPDTDAEKIRRAKDADVLVNSRGAISWPGHVLSALPRLRFITTCGIGTDAIDLVAARDLGIVVSNIPGKTAGLVAEHALALMLTVARRTAFQTAELRAGRWTSVDNIFLAGKTLGIVGAGSIGAATAALGRAIGMKVLAWTFHPSAERAAQLGLRFVELDDLLRTSDVVSLHLKLTPDSQHRIGRREFDLMKPTSILVNTARGGLVDTDALVEALRDGRLAGAGLDVFEAEPLPADHPLLSCAQAVLTPHAADQTPEGYDLLNRGVLENVRAFQAGRPQNVVT